MRNKEGGLKQELTMDVINRGGAAILMGVTVVILQCYSQVLTIKNAYFFFQTTTNSLWFILYKTEYTRDGAKWRDQYDTT